MTSAQIRQSFLDFFREKEHSVVPSASLLPDSPNLLFTNAGMNQFVPIFLGQQKPTWNPPRVVDTQKCIRAGGKHNDLDDVGLDTYHHTFFEMLGNWSFGDYFKKEAIEWAWELVVERWGLPPQRLYATVYKPGPNEPSEFDQEAHDHWARLFTKAGLDPAVQIVNGNKKDNFWMMGDTGPCGPCSELHIDLTPAGDTKGSLVNADDPRCIEIWNLVFIQFNANADGSFVPLPARHVDTGMGFERITAMIQGTENFTDFSKLISNYETDVFRPIFDEIQKLSGKHYGSTLPKSGSTGDNEQENIDVAFRVVADHIRMLSFAIADGIQPSNENRGYVLRRILRRAVRYGRTLGFHEPFFYRLVDVLVRTMSDVFREIAAKQNVIQETLRREEESFNKTLDKGIELFEREASRLGSAGASPAVSRASRDTSVHATAPGAIYHKRRLPHFERPWAKYMVTFSTRKPRQLSPAERDITLATILHDAGKKYELYAACVMPDHVHLLLEPQIEKDDAEGKPVFYALTDILQTLKSVLSHRINKAGNAKGERVWENESFDRMIRSEADLEEKFDSICRNPWDAGVVKIDGGYAWLWTPDNAPVSREARDTAGGAPALPIPERVISGDFAFRLYDEQGFPLDLTELMARERGLTVDTAGFEKLMDEQRSRARAAQKKQVVELSRIETKEPTHFLGYDHDHTGADVLEVVAFKDKTAVVLNNSVCYAEMGGQVGDTGELTGSGKLWRILNTQKSGNTSLHFIEGEYGPGIGEHVTVEYDAARRRAIQRHHTVTHLLHWALHEIVSHEATQKGSFVGPDKLTFDFNSAALTSAQVRDIERLVNEKIIENDAVEWAEVPYAEVRRRPDIMQFFGDKYGETVRVVQIGGRTHGPRNELAFDGYSIELCAGTHTRATGEIGLFRIVSEAAIASGVRRIEAIAGVNAYDFAARDTHRLLALANKVGTPLPDLEKRIDSLLAQQEALEKQQGTLLKREAHMFIEQRLKLVDLTASMPIWIDTLPLQEFGVLLLPNVLEALKFRFKGVAVLGGVDSTNSVQLGAYVSHEYTAKVHAGKVIQAIAPIVGGKGGGRPDNARGAGKDPSKIGEALAHARTLLGS